jgi:hypothetical protein
MKTILTLASATALAAFAAGTAGATVVGGAVTGGDAAANGGVFVNLTPASGTVGADNFNDYNLRAFDEQQDVTLTSAYAADFGVNLNVGDIVNSHYVVYDPDTTRPIASQEGYIDFNKPVLAVIFDGAVLDASDSELGLASVTYALNGDPKRGPEGADTVTINPGEPGRVYISWKASTPGDDFRVITDATAAPIAAAIPVPAALPLLATALGLFGFFGRRKA